MVQLLMRVHGQSKSLDVSESEDIWAYVNSDAQVAQLCGRLIVPLHAPCAAAVAAPKLLPVVQHQHHLRAVYISLFCQLISVK